MKKVLFSLMILASSSAMAQADVYHLLQKSELNNPALQAEYRAMQADKEILNKANAAFLPDVTLSANYSNSEGSDSTTSGVALSQALYNKPAFTLYEQAEKQAGLASLNWQKALQDHRLAFADLWLSVWLAKQNVALVKSEKESTDLQLEKAELAFKLGSANQMDLLEAKAQSDLVQSKWLQAQSDLEIEQKTLANFVGIALKDIHLFTQTLDQLKQLTGLEFESDLDNNIDLRKARLALSIARDSLQAKQDESMPTLNLTAQYNESDVAIQEGGTVGLSLNWNVFDRGLRGTEKTELRYKEEQAKFALQDGQESVQLSYEQLIETRKTLQQKLIATQAAVDSSKAFLDLAEQGYQEGLKSLLDVFQARSNFFGAKQSLYETQKEAFITDLQLLAVTNQLTAETFQGL